MPLIILSSSPPPAGILDLNARTPPGCNRGSADGLGFVSAPPAISHPTVGPGRPPLPEHYTGGWPLHWPCPPHRPALLPPPQAALTHYDDLLMVLAPYLHGERYSSYGRHFTSHKLLHDVAERCDRAGAGAG